MLAEEQNPYAALGVERSADTRTIKRAYTALIRKYSPETHPEEFKRVRAAYELLSDEDARARYDAADKGFGEYGEEVAARLGNAEEALRQGNTELAERALSELLVDKPDLDIARVRLGVLYLRADQHQKAEEQFRRLLARAPEHARHHFHLGVALAGLDRREDASRAFERALDLEPKHVDARLALSAQQRALGHTQEALSVLEQGLTQVEPRSGDFFVLKVRRLEVLMATGADLAPELLAITQEARAAQDDELARYVGSLLASVAAHGFATERGEIANQVLSACEQLNPETLLERPLPACVRAPLEKLPDQGRAWLTSPELRASPATLLEGRWWLPLGGLLLSFGLFLLLVHWATHLDTDVGVEHVFVLLLATAAMAGVSLSLREILEQLSSPVRPITTLHSVYLVRLRKQLVELYPLLQLTNVAGTHHHTNGAYTHSSLYAWFGKQKVGVTIRNREAADHWLQRLQHYRARCLELMSEGCIDAIEGGDMFPARTLQEIASSAADREIVRAERKSQLAWLGGGAVALLLVIGYTAFVVEATAQRARIAPATQARTVAEYQRYLREVPNGAYAELARREVDRAFERAEKQLVSAGLSKRGTGATMFSILDALKRQHTTTLALVAPQQSHLHALRALISALALEEVMLPVRASSLPRGEAVQVVLSPHGEQAWTFGLATEPNQQLAFESPDDVDALAIALHRALGARVFVEQELNAAVAKP